MGKIDHRRLTRSQYEALGREFFSTCQSARSVKQLSKFLNGMLTPSERIMIARRIRVAKKVLKKQGQVAIQDQLGVGQSTVDTVERFLEKMGPEEKRMLR
tara:strand:+ start:104 stop:403 length:300 start_codon:yes stop_codon:yes gene_type:complete